MRREQALLFCSPLININFISLMLNMNVKLFFFLLNTVPFSPYGLNA